MGSVGGNAGRGDAETRGHGESRESFLHSPRPPLPASPRPVLAAAAGLCAFVSLITPIAAQQLTDLEPDRPITVEDARPVSFRAFSGAFDWTFTERRNHSNDHGPGFSILYGAARGLEVGTALRYVTRPERNAERGISSGDLFVHALYALTTETASLPALAVRADLQFPTGLDSKGTDVHLALLATRSFDLFRLHGNFRFTRLGDTGPAERSERWEGVAGIDVPAGRRGLTDTLLMADVVVRTHPLIDGPAIVGAEVGARRRIGTQTILFGGAGSEFSGGRDRRVLTLRLGISRMY